jgi:hypothetical protein
LGQATLVRVTFGRATLKKSTSGWATFGQATFGQATFDHCTKSRPGHELVDPALALLLHVPLPDDDDALSDVLRLLAVVEQEFLEAQNGTLLEKLCSGGVAYVVVMRPLQDRNIAGSYPIGVYGFIQCNAHTTITQSSIALFSQKTFGMAGCVEHTCKVTIANINRTKMFFVN